METLDESPIFPQLLSALSPYGMSELPPLATVPEPPLLYYSPPVSPLPFSPSNSDTEFLFESPIDTDRSSFSFTGLDREYESTQCELALPNVGVLQTSEAVTEPVVTFTCPVPTCGKVYRYFLAPLFPNRCQNGGFSFFGITCSMR